MFPLSNDTRTSHRFPMFLKITSQHWNPSKVTWTKSVSINNLKSENSMATLHRSNTPVILPKAKFSLMNHSLIQPSRNLRSLNSTLFSAKSKASAPSIFKTERYEIEQSAPNSFWNNPVIEIVMRGAHLLFLILQKIHLFQQINQKKDGKKGFNGTKVQQKTS